MITLEQALARADTMTGCTETQEVVKVLAAEVRRFQGASINAMRSKPCGLCYEPGIYGCLRCRGSGTIFY